MDLAEAKEILSRVRYRQGWFFNVADRGDYLTLQVRFSAPDLVTGCPEYQNGRKWLVSRYSTPSELVTTAFKAVLTAEEHEIRESFRYRGKMIFGPHFNVEALVSVAGSTECREDPRSVEHD